MEFGVLGPLVVAEGDHRYSLGGPKQRAVLAVLIAHAGSSVGMGTLIDSLYGDEASERAHRSIHTFVSNLRSELGEVIERDGEGYSFSADPMMVDAYRFEAAVSQAQLMDDPASTSALLREGLGLWRGFPYADVDVYDALSAETARLNELRVAALGLRIDAELAEGRHAALVAELESLTAEYPLRESFWAQQMLALYRSGRQAEALRSFNKARSQLVEETGLDPSPELQDLELRILDHDPSLLHEARPSIRKAAILVADVADLATLTSSTPVDRDALIERQTKAVAGAVARHEGNLFAHRGSAMYAVFDGVDDAASAATDALSELLNSAGSMRMAVTFGDVEARSGGEVVGPPVNRAAALVGAGHGGQVLLAADAHLALTDAGGAGWVIRSLGSHSLEGMPDSIAVHQIVVEGTPDSFPPLRVRGLPPPLPGTGGGLPGYELREEVGSGVFGVVHRAYQPSVGREVAIKIIRPELANHPEFIRRFEVEAHLVARLEHPHIVPLHDYWREPDGAFLVMRWLRGGSLATRLESGPLGVGDVHFLLGQVVPALEHAHRQGVVHRDLKPSNVLFDDDGNTYLTDFGVATRIQGGDAGDIAGDVRGLGQLIAASLAGAEVSDEVARFLAEVADGRFGDLDSLLQAWAVATGVNNTASDEIRFTPARNPYKGLRAFGELDAADFYGRAEETQQLLGAVASRRMVAVVGPSGIGKSSVVRAGLLPALRNGAVSGSAEWLITDLLPGAYPYEELAAALSRVAIEPSVDLEDQLRSDERGLLRATDRYLPDGAQLLVVVDQFEELFTLVDDEDERAAFLDLLYTAATDQGSRIHVVLTMRVDFFDQPLRFGEFGEILRSSTVPIAAPSESALRDVIEKPASAVGVTFESGLVERMVGDVKNQPGALPLLEFSLTELFAGRGSDELSGSGYEDSGGVLGALGRRAEQIYKGLDRAGRSAARQVFLRLINVAESGSDTRRRVRLRELEQLGIDPDRLRSLVDVFGNHRLLTFDRDSVTRSPTVEVAHEAILTQWPRLADWVSDQREDLLLHSRLAAAVSDWESSDRATPQLLQTGRLAQHEAWSSSTDVLLTSPERDFLRLSREEEDRLRAQRRRVRRRVMVGFGAAAVLAIAFALVASLQRSNAQQAQAVATSRELAALAIAQLEIDPERSVLLALEAIDFGRDAEADLLESTTALHTALAANSLVGRFEGGSFVAASPDGAIIATGSQTGEVILRDLDSGEVTALQRPDAIATGAAFSPVGGMLAVTYDGPGAPLRLWDLENGTYQQFDGPEVTGNSPPHIITFDGSGDLVATLLADGVHVWSTADGKLEHTIELIDVVPEFVAGTSHLLLADWLGRSFHTFDLASGESISEVPVASRPGSATVSADGQVVVATYQATSSVVAYDVGTDAELWSTTVDRPAGAAWLSDGVRVATGSDGGRITILDGASGDILDVLSGGHSGVVWALAAVPGREILATSGGEDGTTLLRDVEPGLSAEVFRFDTGVRQAQFVTYAPFPEQVFASGFGEPATAGILDTATGQTVFDVANPAVGSSAETRVLNNGSLLAVVTADGRSEVVDTTSRMVVYAAPEGMLVRAASHDESMLLVTPDPDAGPSPGLLQIVETTSGDVTAVLDAESLSVPFFSYDDRLIIDWGSHPDFPLFDASTGEMLLNLSGAVSVRPMPDGTTLSIVDKSGKLSHASFDDLLAGKTFAEAARWSDFATQGLVVPLGHVANADGSLVAVTGKTNEPVNIWDAASGTRIASLYAGLATGIPQVFFHPDEPYVTLLSEGGVLLTFTLDTDQLIEIAESRVTRSLTDIECQTFLHMDTCPDS